MGHVITGHYERSGGFQNVKKCLQNVKKRLQNSFLCQNVKKCLQNVT